MSDWSQATKAIPVARNDIANFQEFLAKQEPQKGRGMRSH